MALTLVTVLAFLRRHALVLALGTLLVGSIFALATCETDSVEWSKQIEQIERSNAEAIKKIEAAHAAEKAEMQKSIEAYRQELEASKRRYEAEKAEILRRRNAEVKAVLDRSGGDPSVIAHEMAKLFGFQVLERNKK